MREIMARVQQIDGIIKAEQPMRVRQELLQDKDLPSLNTLFLEVVAAVMAAKDRGETGIGV